MTTSPDRVGNRPYVIAGLSYVPLIGIIFGVVAIGIGLATRKRGGRTVAAIGAGGILLSVVLYGGLFYFGFVQRGGVYDDLRTHLAQTTLNNLVDAVEVHKLKQGAYPETLEELKAALPKDSFVFITDPTDIAMQRTFYYRRVDADHYMLRGLGLDGVPFTSDDIVPTVEPKGKMGLLVDAPSNR